MHVELETHTILGSSQPCSTEYIQATRLFSAQTFAKTLLAFLKKVKFCFQKGSFQRSFYIRL